ncbi:MAG TPA: hypothetical protein VMS23_02370, partial [Terrimicrobiaceae bacterium]|nr:hypothetical protein [Terrimicrobiaceae bacterium]
RLQFFDSLEQVESFLAGLSGGTDPLVRILPARPGQKEKRYVQLISGEPVTFGDIDEGRQTSIQPVEASPSRSEALEDEIAALRDEVRQLRQELLSFRKQFE